MICLVVPHVPSLVPPCNLRVMVMQSWFFTEQGIIWPDANCAPVGLPCSRNNISSYVADNCAEAGLQRGSDGMGVAVDPNKDLYDWPRHCRSDGFLVSDFMCTQSICWCKDLCSMPNFTSANRKIYPDLPKCVPHCAPRVHLDGTNCECGY